MTPSAPTTTRKKPHCHTCGSPMAGHRRQHGSPICPASPKHSPHPPSPPASPQPKRRSRTPPMLQPAQYVAPLESHQGAVRRRNPNWRSPQRARLLSPAGSLVPTVLVDEDGRTIKDTDLTDNEFDGLDVNDDDGIGLGLGLDAGKQRATGSYVLMSHLAELGRPVVSIFDTRREDIPHIRETAARLGVHSAVVHRGAPRKGNGRVTREHSWWVVLGQNAGFVNQVIDGQQGGMPGVVGSDMEMAAPVRMVTFFQLVIAGLIAGGAVVFGLSML